MNAKYLGKKINRNEFGDIVSTFSPAVMSHKTTRTSLNFM